MSCISLYSGHFFRFVILIVRTQRFYLHFGTYMAFNQCDCLSYRRTRQFTNISAAPVSATVSVSNVNSALMHRPTKLLSPDECSRFNERRTDANLHAFVAINADISSSHDKNQIHVHSDPV